MYITLIFTLFLVYILIRTIAFGIYSIKTTGLLGGISVFLLALSVAVTGYMVVFLKQQ